MRRGLTVNTSKSEVIHFNSRSCSSLPTFMYGDVVLPEKEQCKYLGTLVDKHINLKVHEKHTVRPYMASQQRIKEFAHEHDLKNREAPLLCKGCSAAENFPDALQPLQTHFSRARKCLTFLLFQDFNGGLTDAGSSTGAMGYDSMHGMDLGVF
eukprot:1153384-Pelagomonas_calceolata.AAC.5